MFLIIIATFILKAICLPSDNYKLELKLNFLQMSQW